MSQFNDKEKQKKIQDLFDLWSAEADFDGILSYYGQQELAVRELVDAGECFIIKHFSEDSSRAVPLELQLIEADHCPHSKNERTADGGTIRNGIEYNKEGRRVAYWLYKEHPSERRFAYFQYEPERIPAENVIHIFHPLRAGQTRGIPWNSSALARLYSTDKLDDAVTLRQEIANLFAMFIRQTGSDPDPKVNPLTGLPLDPDEEGYQEATLEPGISQTLAPGQEVEFSDPPDPGNVYGDYMRHQLLAAAAASGMPYEVLSGDYRHVNERVLRPIMQGFRRRVGQTQQNVLMHQLCRGVWTAWFDMAVLVGAIKAPGYATRRDEYQRVRWVGQGFPHFHPLQDVEATIKEIRAGLTSRDEKVLTTTNRDPDDLDAEISRANQRVDEAGLIFDTDPRKIDKAGEAQNGDDAIMTFLNKELESDPETE